MKRKSHLFYMLLLGLSLCANASLAQADAVNEEPLSLFVPVQSTDGSFVVRVKYSRQNIEAGSMIELWRRYESGEYTLVSRQAPFDAISQILYKPGHYHYKAKIVRPQGNDFEQLATSDAKEIDVQLRHSLKVSGIF